MAPAKASHTVLLCRMEQREITSWSETKNIDRVKHANAQRHDLPTAVFKDHKIQYYIKALKLNRPLLLKTLPFSLSTFFLRLWRFAII